jgi:hypothetical protein
MPDNSETTDYAAYKKAWVWTCYDSLIQTYHRAIENYKSGYAIPQPPPPPDQVEVKSGGDRITLKWSSIATSDAHFDGYRIYRAEGSVNSWLTVWNKIFECGKADVVHQYNDVNAARSKDYYYYIVSKDNGQQDPAHPGTPLVSGKFYIMTSRPSYLRRPSGDSLEDIRIVPNPYLIDKRSLQFGEVTGYDRIAFYGLPPECKIRVFTERGDLIWSREHNDGSGDELWESLTSSGQIIVSGIYIAYFETPAGQSTYRKLLVIR